MKVVSSQWSGVRKGVFCITLCAILFALCSTADAQQPAKAPQIGYLSNASRSSMSPRTDAFRLGLRELGYLEGETIFVERRNADGKIDRLPALVAELVRLKVDVIITGGPQATRAAKEATSTIPIVMANVGDPVGEGFVASLARPGGNITGLSALAPELSGKRLELLREVVPKLTRVAVLGTASGPGVSLQLRELEPAAKAFKVQLHYLDVQNPKDIDSAFRAASKERADAVITLGGGILVSQRAQIVELAAKNRLPAIYHQGWFVEDGGLMYYGVNLLDLDRRAATYVDRILKGAKPADLPVEQPTKFEFVINLRAANQIRLMIPPNVLARADKVIK